MEFHMGLTKALDIWSTKIQIMLKSFRAAAINLNLYWFQNKIKLLVVFVVGW